jgi:hypothetical protein
MARSPIRFARMARDMAFLLGLLSLPGTAALAAEPAATYLIQTRTSSSLLPTAPSLGQMLMGGGAMGSKRQIQRNLDLTLTAPVAPPARAEASHAIPPAMGMGATLSLAGSSGCTTGDCGSKETRQAIEQMRSRRVLLYWGCEARAGAGQPQTLEPRNNPLLLGMEEVLRQDKGQPAAPSTTQTSWPHPGDARSIPAQASLAGEHLVRSNYTLPIRFPLAPQQDFLAPLNLSAASAGGAATDLSWNRVAGVVGYRAMAMGQAGGESAPLVLWVSSRGGESASDGDSSATLQSLVSRGALLGAERSQCTISAEASRALGMAAVTLEGYAGAIRLDPAPGQVVRLERSTTGMVLLGMPQLEGSGAAGAAGGGEAPADRAPQPAPRPGLGLLKGLF